MNHSFVVDPPRWAAGFGEDRFGVFAVLEVEGVEHRFRWIPPGTFQQGSPESTRAGWFGEEGPQRMVTFTRPFWMGETPVTQDLWSVVMGVNPSRFQSMDRPVEQVSFEDVEQFAAALRERVPGLRLGLPTEAQWEYACRAGTVAETYAGDLRVLGKNNAPVLDAIAWYGGNSGVAFELDGGKDIRNWEERRYSDPVTAGTHPVRRKEPNPWGLCDMLGNVWEWCEDRADWTPAAYEPGPVSDPPAVRTGSDRVYRGGSCSGYARYCRAAYRSAYRPGRRWSSLGFRLVEVMS